MQALARADWDVRFPAPAALAPPGARAAHGRLDERRRRRGRSAGGGRGERRRHGARGGARRAARRLLVRLRLRRSQGRAVRRVRQPEPAVRLRQDEAPRRGRGGRERLGRAELVALRPDGAQLRAHDASARSRARRGRRRRRPARLPDLRRASGGRDARARRRRRAVRRLAPRRGRRLHLGRLRRGDLRGGRARLPGAADHDGGVRCESAAARRSRSCAARRPRRSCRTGATASPRAWPRSKGTRDGV